MNVLVACEESQIITKLLREKNINAFSCDLQLPSGDLPQYHINQDVIPLLNGNCDFHTLDGEKYTIIGKWDCILAFPPCTHLAVSGARHFEKKRENGLQLDAIEFFSKFIYADCDKIMIENPVNIIGGKYIKEHFPQFSHLPKPTQRIQPYYFGDKSRKTTCLWLKNLPELKPTEIVEPKLVTYICKDGKKVTFSKDYGAGGKENGKRRSKTYPGIANAIVEQWF